MQFILGDVILPINPERVKYAAGSKFVEFDTIALGEIAVPRGRRLRRLSWSGKLLGPGRTGEVYVQSGASTRPHEIAARFLAWMDNNVSVRFDVTGTSLVGMPVYIESFEYDIWGGYGDLDYTITLREARGLPVTSVVPGGGGGAPAPSGPSTAAAPLPTAPQGGGGSGSGGGAPSGSYQPEPGQPAQPGLPPGDPRNTIPGDPDRTPPEDPIPPPSPPGSGIPVWEPILDPIPDPRPSTPIIPQPDTEPGPVIDPNPRPIPIPDVMPDGTPIGDPDAEPNKEPAPRIPGEPGTNPYPPGRSPDGNLPPDWPPNTPGKMPPPETPPGTLGPDGKLPPGLPPDAPPVGGPTIPRLPGTGPTIGGGFPVGTAPFNPIFPPFPRREEEPTHGPPSWDPSKPTRDEGGPIKTGIESHATRAVQAASTVYTAKAGDTAFSIAKIELGDSTLWNDLVKQNATTPGVSALNDIPAGTKIVLPHGVER